MTTQPKSNRTWIIAVVTALMLGLGWATFFVPVGAPKISEQPAESADDRPASQPPLQSDGRLDSDVKAALKGPSAPVQQASDAFAKYGDYPDRYAGTAACASCHSDRHKSYLKTHHSRSLREVDLASEKHDVTLMHPTSKSSYDIVAKDGQLWHRQRKHFSDAPEDRVQAGQLPVRYVMGSGAFAKGYLLADGDYLVQSPVTWYVGASQYGMAPGYDATHHRGFTRMIGDDCLFCHAGVVSRRHDNPNHPAIHELSIGCERCHGPGAEHAQLFRQVESGELTLSDDLDLKIIDPKRLSRTQAESICSQCHLLGDVVSHAPGVQAWDFVPGDDLAKTLVHYKDGSPREFGKVFTGHFDQLWQSSCYTKSETLTCITCHDSHRTETIPDQTHRYREQCNRCHEDQGCGLPLDQRIGQQQNDCIKCHMPSIDSEIPHTSTTNHWIAVYESGKPRGAKPSLTVSPKATALRRVPQSPALRHNEILRHDLLAETRWTVQQTMLGNPQLLRSFDLNDKLAELYRNDPADAEIDSVLAHVARLTADATQETPTNRSIVDAEWKLARTHAMKALQLEPRPVKPRATALEVLGNERMRAEDYASAVECFTELTRIRRAAVDWYNLGICLARERRMSAAEKALHEAIRIDATYAAPYRSLSILYRTADPARSRQLAVMAQRLTKP